MQNFTIIASKQDIAGLNIHAQLLANYSFKPSGSQFDGNPIYSLAHNSINFQLVLINEFQIYADYVDSIKADLFIFASKHKGEKPALTVHPIGNPCQAKYGGKDFEFVPTSPFIMKSYLQNLNSNLSSLSHNYSATYEATHHGPFLSKPTIFIEQGGSEKEWADEEAAKLIAETIMNHSAPSEKVATIAINPIQSATPANSNPANQRVAIGIGDMHYPHYFSKLALQTDIAFSHIIPKHNTQFLSPELIHKLINASPQLDLFILDWKNLGQEKEKITSLIEETKIPWGKAQKLI